LRTNPPLHIEEQQKCIITKTLHGFRLHSEVKSPEHIGICFV